MTLAIESPGAEAAPPRPAPVRKPKNTEELRALVGRAITALRRIHSVEARREARIAYYQQKIDDLKHQAFKQRNEQLTLIQRIMPRVHEFIEANRFELTHHGRRKTVGFPDGTFKWQPSRFTDIPDEEEFFREVRGLNLAEMFIRTKEEPNRSALLDENNKEQAAKLTSARIVEETRPQLTTTGTTFRIERVKGENEDEFAWTVVDSRQR